MSPDSYSELDMNQITKNLYIGDRGSATHRDVLEDLGITHIVVAGSQLQAHFPEHFRYCHVNVRDSAKEDISVYFNEVSQFIDEALTKKQGVLVHCAFGISRSATLVIAYMMKKMKISYLEAVNYVKRKRPTVGPNGGFQVQLQRLEMEGIK